jgi:hypothetical protein
MSNTGPEPRIIAIFAVLFLVGQGVADPGLALVQIEGDLAVADEKVFEIALRIELGEPEKDALCSELTAALERSLDALDGLEFEDGSRKDAKRLRRRMTRALSRSERLARHLDHPRRSLRLTRRIGKKLESAEEFLSRLMVAHPPPDPVAPSAIDWSLPWSVLANVETLPDGMLMEVSGVEVSEMNDGIIWAHDDSGNDPDLYAIRLSDGMIAQRYHLDDIRNVDWEDMAIGPGPVSGESYIYIFDDVDNYVLRLLEPDVPSTPGSTISIASTDYETFRFDDIGGGEVLLVDPDTGMPYVISFAENVYKFPTPMDSSETVTLTLVATLPEPIIEDPPSYRGGDVSPGKDRIVLRSYLNIYEFLRPAGGSFEDMFMATPKRTDASGQGQAESLSFGLDGLSLYTISESSTKIRYITGSAGE